MVGARGGDRLVVAPERVERWLPLPWSAMLLGESFAALTERHLCCGTVACRDRSPIGNSPEQAESPNPSAIHAGRGGTQTSHAGAFFDPYLWAEYWALE